MIFPNLMLSDLPLFLFVHTFMSANFFYQPLRAKKVSFIRQIQNSLYQIILIDVWYRKLIYVYSMSTLCKYRVLTLTWVFLWKKWQIYECGFRIWSDPRNEILFAVLDLILYWQMNAVIGHRMRHPRNSDCQQVYEI